MQSGGSFPPGQGGTGGGGDGNKGQGSPQGVAGTVNTGGGAGGGDGGVTGNAGGGSGIIILRVATVDYSGGVTGSPTVSVIGADTVIAFNGTGSYTA